MALAWPLSAPVLDFFCLIFEPALDFLMLFEACSNAAHGHLAHAVVTMRKLVAASGELRCRR